MIDIKWKSGTKWEEDFNYARVVRRGNFIAVSGTTSMDKTTLIGADNAAEQTAFILSKIGNALAKVGSQMQDIVRTRIYITNQADANAVLTEHAKAFEGINPCATLLVVKGFIDARLLVEIEADAITPS